MRQPRNCKSDTCCRLVRRVADRGFFFGEEDWMRIVAQMWRAACFACTEILMCYVMSSRFDILAFAPTNGCVITVKGMWALR